METSRTHHAFLDCFETFGPINQVSGTNLHRALEFLSPNDDPRESLFLSVNAFQLCFSVSMQFVSTTHSARCTFSLLTGLEALLRMD